MATGAARSRLLSSPPGGQDERHARASHPASRGSCETLSAMDLLLVTCGLVLTGIGTWSGYRSAREAIVPALNPGDPTRSVVDAARPVYDRTAVRRFARSVAFAIGWLVVALYGLFLVSAGSVVGAPS